jgi:hypothetical protein
MACGPAAAAPTEPGAKVSGIPQIAPGLTYGAARTRLAQAGFRPVPFRRRLYAALCADRACRTPEIWDCSQGGHGYCWFLFARRSDGRLLTVRTDNDSHRYDIAYWTDDRDLTVLTSGPYAAAHPTDQRRIKAAAARAAVRRPPGAPERLPLCSESQGRQPCWVKPPQDYSLPPKKAY